MAGGKPRCLRGFWGRHLVGSVQGQELDLDDPWGSLSIPCSCGSVVCPHEQPLWLHSRLIIIITNIIMCKSVAESQKGQQVGQEISQGGHCTGERWGNGFSWQFAACSPQRWKEPSSDSNCSNQSESHLATCLHDIFSPCT